MLNALSSPVLLQGDATTAFRDPAVVFAEGEFHLFFTHVTPDVDAPGQVCLVTAVSRSADLKSWSPPHPLMPRDRRLNYSSPGNIVRYGEKWVMCLQTYPRPNGEKYGDASARLFTISSDDLCTWGEPQLMRVKGDAVEPSEMGRMIDPYLLRDKDDAGKWWCLFKQNGVSTAWSRDLERWHFAGAAEAGENVCAVVDGDEYVLFHSPENGIGVKRSRDLSTWRDVGLITLDQPSWPWARGRLTAGFVLDMRSDPRVGKYLLFFHGSGPEDERTMFDTHASIGLAWSSDLRTWHWPGCQRPQVI